MLVCSWLVFNICFCLEKCRRLFEDVLSLSWIEILDLSFRSYSIILSTDSRLIQHERTRSLKLPIHLTLIDMDPKIGYIMSKSYFVLDIGITPTRTLHIPSLPTGENSQRHLPQNHFTNTKEHLSRQENHQQSPSTPKITAAHRPQHGRRQARLPPRLCPHPRIHRRHHQPTQQRRNRKPHGRLHANDRTLETEFRAV